MDNQDIETYILHRRHFKLGYTAYFFTVIFIDLLKTDIYMNRICVTPQNELYFIFTRFIK